MRAANVAFPGFRTAMRSKRNENKIFQNILTICFFLRFWVVKISKSIFELSRKIAFAAGCKTAFRGMRLIICAGFVLGVLAGCFEVEKVSGKKPYAVSVKKERSYYQAQKIVEHLADLGIPSYVVEKGEDKDRYFHVVSKPFQTEDEAENFREHLASMEMEKGEIFSFDDLSEEERKNLANRKIYMQEERQRIPAETPDVPRSILSTIRKVPGSNAFYISQERGSRCKKDLRRTKFRKENT